LVQGVWLSLRQPPGRHCCCSPTGPRHHRRQAPTLTHSPPPSAILIPLHTDPSGITHCKAPSTRFEQRQTRHLLPRLRTPPHSEHPIHQHTRHPQSCRQRPARTGRNTRRALTTTRRRRRRLRRSQMSTSSPRIASNHKSSANTCKPGTFKSSRLTTPHHTPQH
jgi:hypothetical protein